MAKVYQCDRCEKIVKACDVVFLRVASIQEPADKCFDLCAECYADLINKLMHNQVECDLDNRDTCLSWTLKKSNKCQ